MTEGDTNREIERDIKKERVVEVRRYRERGGGEIYKIF